jgi:hypothetical protein
MMLVHESLKNARPAFNIHIPPRQSTARPV